MDYSKFSCEMTSPEYVDYFYSLSSLKKEAILSSQNHLYKGINASLINAIYDKLYLLSLEHSELSKHIRLINHSELKDIQPHQNKMRLHFFQTEKQQEFDHKTEAVILATGYENRTPFFLQSVKELLATDASGRLAVQRNYSIDKEGKSLFIQNAELLTHGFNAADLGLGVYRNAVIIDSILGYEHYTIEDGCMFQTFGCPKE